MSYQDFLSRKRRVWTGVGGGVDAVMPTQLYQWQAAIVRWALKKGRAAIFADCGLGKTLMQVAWADALNVPTLILAPLCVAEQTVAEALKIGVTVQYATDQSRVSSRIAITNYERLPHFDPSKFQAVVLDESSILKAFDGKTRTALIDAFKNTTFRLCCTATPSPNDVTELANHAEFLGLMTRPEFLATWFIRTDAGLRATTHHGWRMKRHAVEPFYRWLSSWAVAMRSPSDIGYDDAGFLLPPLQIHDEILPIDGPIGNSLFPEMGMHGLSGRLAARRTSLEARVSSIQRMTKASRSEHGQCAWLLWCGLNEESSALADAIPEAVEVRGDDTYAEKVAAVQGFVSGKIRVLVSKLKILGFGMNFQHCHHMAFVGISDSYESYYQGIRRAWRYGQRSPVSVHIVVSEAEKMVVDNVRRKEAAASALSDNLLRHMRDFEREEVGAA